MTPATARIVHRTARLVLRHMVADDAPFALRLLNDPDFLRFVGDRGVRDAEGARAYIADGPIASYREHDHGTYVLERKDAAEPMGICGLVRRELLDHVDLGFAMLPEFRGRGYAVEAGEVVLQHAHAVRGMERVLAIASPENAASIALLEVLGMVRIGSFRFPDESVDLALLASDGDTIRTHVHGTAGPEVVVLHGGPGARGSARDLCKELASSFRVFEPWQRRRGPEPLTVARHVEDLHAVIRARCDPETPPVIVGESWGAMLALAYAATHPGSVAAIALVGCGTFDRPARERMHEVLHERMSDDLRVALVRARDIPDPDIRLAETHALLEPLYGHDPGPRRTSDPLDLDARGHEEAWEDMIRLQEDGTYPAAFSRISCPVRMFHGEDDPHPGSATRDTLREAIPGLEYRSWPRCGHAPWRERGVREAFLDDLRGWLHSATRGGR